MDALGSRINPSRLEDSVSGAKFWRAIPGKSSESPRSHLKSALLEYAHPSALDDNGIRWVSCPLYSL